VQEYVDTVIALGVQQSTVLHCFGKARGGAGGCVWQEEDRAGGEPQSVRLCAGKGRARRNVLKYPNT
jgi:hypothetical protein